MTETRVKISLDFDVACRLPLLQQQKLMVCQGRKLDIQEQELGQFVQFCVDNKCVASGLALLLEFADCLEKIADINGRLLYQGTTFNGAVGSVFKMISAVRTQVLMMRVCFLCARWRKLQMNMVPISISSPQHKDGSPLTSFPFFDTLTSLYNCTETLAMEFQDRSSPVMQQFWSYNADLRHRAFMSFIALEREVDESWKARIGVFSLPVLRCPAPKVSMRTKAELNHTAAAMDQRYEHCTGLLREWCAGYLSQVDADPTTTPIDGASITLLRSIDDLDLDMSCLARSFCRVPFTFRSFVPLVLLDLGHASVTPVLGRLSEHNTPTASPVAFSERKTFTMSSQNGTPEFHDLPPTSIVLAPVVIPAKPVEIQVQSSPSIVPPDEVSPPLTSSSQSDSLNGSRRETRVSQTLFPVSTHESPAASPAASSHEISYLEESSAPSTSQPTGRPRGESEPVSIPASLSAAVSNRTVNVGNVVKLPALTTATTPTKRDSHAKNNDAQHHNNNNNNTSSNTNYNIVNPTTPTANTNSNHLLSNSAPVNINYSNNTAESTWTGGRPRLATFPMTPQDPTPAAAVVTVAPVAPVAAVAAQTQKVTANAPVTISLQSSPLPRPFSAAPAQTPKVIPHAPVSISLQSSPLQLLPRSSPTNRPATAGSAGRKTIPSRKLTRERPSALFSTLQQISNQTHLSIQDRAVLKIKVWFRWVNPRHILTLRLRSRAVALWCIDFILDTVVATGMSRQRNKRRMLRQGAALLLQSVMRGWIVRLRWKRLREAAALRKEHTDKFFALWVRSVQLGVRAYRVLRKCYAGVLRRNPSARPFPALRNVLRVFTELWVNRKQRDQREDLMYRLERGIMRQESASRWTKQVYQEFNAAVNIQKNIRMFLVHRLARKRKMMGAATVKIALFIIHATTRKRRRREFARRHAAERIQRCWRGWKARLEVYREVQAGLILKVIWRKHMAYRSLKSQLRRVDRPYTLVLHGIRNLLQKQLHTDNLRIKVLVWWNPLLHIVAKRDFDSVLHSKQPQFIYVSNAAKVFNEADLLMQQERECESPHGGGRKTPSGSFVGTPPPSLNRAAAAAAATTPGAGIGGSVEGYASSSSSGVTTPALAPGVNTPVQLPSGSVSGQRSPVSSSSGGVSPARRNSNELVGSASGTMTLPPIGSPGGAYAGAASPGGVLLQQSPEVNSRDRRRGSVMTRPSTASAALPTQSPNTPPSASSQSGGGALSVNTSNDETPPPRSSFTKQSPNQCSSRAGVRHRIMSSALRIGSSAGAKRNSKVNNNSKLACSFDDEVIKIPGCHGNSVIRFEIYDGERKLGFCQFPMAREGDLMFWGGDYAAPIMIIQQRRAVQFNARMMTAREERGSYLGKDAPLFEFKVIAGAPMRSKCQWARMVVHGRGFLKRSLQQRSLLLTLSPFDQVYRFFLSLDEFGLNLFENKYDFQAFHMVPVNEFRDITTEVEGPGVLDEIKGLVEDNMNVKLTTKSGDEIYMRFPDAVSRLAWIDCFTNAIQEQVKKNSLAIHKSGSSWLTSTLSRVFQMSTKASKGSVMTRGSGDQADHDDSSSSSSDDSDNEQELTTIAVNGPKSGERSFVGLLTSPSSLLKMAVRGKSIQDGSLATSSSSPHSGGSGGGSSLPPITRNAFFGQSSPSLAPPQQTQLTSVRET